MTFDPIPLPHLSARVNAVILAVSIMAPYPDILLIPIGLYTWSQLAAVLGR